MGTPGFVYVLINPSLPSYVKIGKTAKDPSIRAAELSSATGVPTPFYVAYEAYFNDCDTAESFIHALLESKGARLSQNREFFSITPTVAINAILEAKSRDETQKKQGSKSHFDAEIDDHEEKYPDELNHKEEPWEGILEEAEKFHYGSDDVLEDHSRAIQLYKEAAKLGSEKAYIGLANLYADSMKDVNQGIQWLKLGTDKGFPSCWLELAEVFCGKNPYFDFSLRNKENAIKCYRRFLSFVDSPGYVEVMYVAFKQYLLLVGARPEQRDIEVSKTFIKKFRDKLAIFENQQGQNEKLRQFNALVGNIRFIE